MTKYIHELPDWPRFRWSMEALAQRLADVRHKQGYLLGRMQVDLFKMGQDGEELTGHSAARHP